MKTVIYKGSPAYIGRFGLVEEGAHLQLMESEFAGVRDDPQFELVSRRKPLRAIEPQGTPLYDLRRIEWEKAGLTIELEREGKGTLKLIAEAMNFLGADIVVTEHDNTPVIVDAIVAEAKALNWDKVDREKRVNLPSSSESAEYVKNEGGEVVESAEGPEGEYSGIGLSGLRALCAERGLVTTGTKQTLIARLEDNDKDQPEE